MNIFCHGIRVKYKSGGGGHHETRSDDHFVRQTRKKRSEGRSQEGDGFYMSLRTAKRQLLRNICWATLFGFLVTAMGAFAARWWVRAWLLLPYGIDDPFAPLFAIIRNSFWVLIALVVFSLFRNEGSPTAALPIFKLNAQIFAGEVFYVLLAVAWHHLGWPGERSAIVVLGLTTIGQLIAYLARIGIKHKSPRGAHH
jgi:hypothetical protein